MHTYIHTYIHPSIHAYIHRYMYTYIHACIYPYIHTYIQASIHPSIHPYIHTCIHPSIHTCIHTYIHKYIHTYTHLPACLLVSGGDGGAGVAGDHGHRHRVLLGVRLHAGGAARLLLPRLVPSAARSGAAGHRALLLVLVSKGLFRLDVSSNMTA